jgi:hypothetical protein
VKSPRIGEIMRPGYRIGGRRVRAFRGMSFFVSTADSFRPPRSAVAKCTAFVEEGFRAKRYAVVPADALELIGPARSREPGPQVVEIGLRNLDAEGTDLPIVYHNAHARRRGGRILSATTRAVKVRHNESGDATVRSEE